MTFIIEVLMRTCIETAYLVGAIVLAGLFLGILRNNSIKNFQRRFGSKAIMITGFIGVPIHELSHGFFALLFGHKITDVKLLQKPDANGVMGYVKHSYNPNNIYHQAGNFFIGTAPIFGGIFSIIALMRIIIPRAYDEFISILIKNLQVTVIDKGTIEGILSSYMTLIKVIFSIKNFSNPYFYIFLFIAISIASHISLSSADIKGAFKGLWVIFAVLLIINVLNLSKYVLAFDLIKYNILITGFLIISVMFSIITFLISLILKGLRA